jgi:PAS domain-containing protein
VDDELQRATAVSAREAAAASAGATGADAGEHVLARHVPWLRLDRVLPAAVGAAQAVLVASSHLQAHAAVLPHLGPALGFAWAVLWLPRRHPVPIDTWRSEALLGRLPAPPVPPRPPPFQGRVTWSVPPAGSPLSEAGLQARLVVPLTSRGEVVGALEMAGSTGCPVRGSARAGVVPPSSLDHLGELLGAALHTTDQLDEARQEARLLAAELEVVPAGTVVVSPEREVLSINEQFLSMFGVPRSQALAGGPTSEALAQVYALAVTELPEILDLLALAHTPGAGAINRTITQRSGRVLEVRGAPVVDELGVYRGRAWFVRDETARHRAEQAVRVLADTLVASLLPPHLPHVPGAELAIRYQASAVEAEIGGDFYDVFSTGQDRWAISFGDVCGSGPEAAVVTAVARHTVRAVAVRQDPPSAVLAALNGALLSQQEEAQRFLTALQLDLHRRPDGGFRVTVACGGHPPAFVRRADGTVERLGTPGTLLGVVDDPELTDVDDVLAVDDVLVLVTDGVLEARDEHGHELGDEGLTRLLAASPGDPERLVDAVADLAAERRVGNKRDDFAVLAFAAVRGGPPRATGV